LTCLVLTIITVACGSAAQAGSLSMPPVNPRHVVIAHSIRAIPGERNGAQVYLALTRPDLTGPKALLRSGRLVYLRVRPPPGRAHI
jgi:hypothetical protein